MLLKLLCRTLFLDFDCFYGNKFCLKICAFLHWVWKFDGSCRSKAQFAKTNAKQERQCIYDHYIMLPLWKYC